jgi:type III restriction enzyme
MIVLKNYQNIAVNGLYNKATGLLQKAGNKILVFRAPTGSGKTIIMAEFLRNLVVENKTNLGFSFIWAAPRQLHGQSKEKLERYYFENKVLKCSYYDELTDKVIAENEVLFLNWESINKEDNIFIRENENEFNLSNVLQNTREQGRQIILIIDESHFSTKTEKAIGLKNLIDAKLTIEVSATPVLTNQLNELEAIDRESVIIDEMIKKYVVINQDFKNDIQAEKEEITEVKTELPETTNEFIISEALKKRIQLAEEFDSLSANVNPLMLIQLPDASAGAEVIKDEIISILKKHGITTDNGKLAVWFSEEKQNRETISQNDDPVEVMLFKQAIAIGWDCPRAHILVMLRDVQSDIFRIQTIGRIMRMPELKHYPVNSLNIGYIYTNLPDYSIQGEEVKGYIVIRTSARKAIYHDLDLPSVHTKRQREKTRLSPQFIPLFLQQSKEANLKSINVNVDEALKTLMSDGKVEDIDKIASGLVAEGSAEYLAEKGTHVARLQQEVEIQQSFNAFINEALAPLYPEDRSVDKLKLSIEAFFKQSYPGQYEYIEPRMQLIVLNNKDTFLAVASKAIGNYLGMYGSTKAQIVPDGNWNVPPKQDYPDGFSKRQVKLAIVEPFFSEMMLRSQKRNL